MKVVLAGGGTGGHVYPGLAVARALEGLVVPGVGDEGTARSGETTANNKQQTSKLRGGGVVAGNRLELMYIGVRGRVDEEIVPKEGIAFRAVSAGPLRVSSPVRFVVNVLKLGLGVLQSLVILLQFRPRAVFATGGYASVPVGIAARILRRPLVVYLPDVTPGWAVRLLSRLATRMTTTSERALKYLPANKTVVAGYPVRPEFWTTDKPTARARLGLPADSKVLVVTGASLGARRINEAVAAALPRLLPRCHVVHVTGAADEQEARALRSRLSAEQQGRYAVHGYLEEMPQALIAADLVVSRAGASVLGELPAAGVPSVLVPGEYEGWSQAPNAEFLQAEGAAVMLRNDELKRMGEVVLELLGDEARLARMSEAARRLARPEAARDLARVLLEVAA